MTKKRTRQGPVLFMDTEVEYISRPDKVTLQDALLATLNGDGTAVRLPQKYKNKETAQASVAKIAKEQGCSYGFRINGDRFVAWLEKSAP